MRRRIRRLAAALLLASLVSPSLTAFRAPLARARDLSPARAAGLNAPAGPVVFALAAAVPVALGAALSVTPRVLAVSRRVAGDRLSEGNARPPFVVKSAPTILRV